MRLRSDLFVAAYLRRRNGDNAFSVVRHRGAAEAGAIFVMIDHLNGGASLYGPAPQMVFDDANPERRFEKISKPGASLAEIEERLAKELRFDRDIWIIDVEDRNGGPALDLVHI